MKRKHKWKGIEGREENEEGKNIIRRGNMANGRGGDPLDAFFNNQLRYDLSKESLVEKYDKSLI